MEEIYIPDPKQLSLVTKETVDRFASWAEALALPVEGRKVGAKALRMAVARQVLIKVSRQSTDVDGLFDVLGRLILTVVSSCVGCPIRTSGTSLPSLSRPQRQVLKEFVTFDSHYVQRLTKKVRLLTNTIVQHRRALDSLHTAQQQVQQYQNAVDGIKSALSTKETELSNMSKGDALNSEGEKNGEIIPLYRKLARKENNTISAQKDFIAAVTKESGIRKKLIMIYDDVLQETKYEIIDRLTFGMKCVRQVIHRLPLDLQDRAMGLIEHINIEVTAGSLLKASSKKYIFPVLQEFQDGIYPAFSPTRIVDPNAGQDPSDENLWGYLGAVGSSFVGEGSSTEIQTSDIDTGYGSTPGQDMPNSGYVRRHPAKGYVRVVQPSQIDVPGFLFLNTAPGQLSFASYYGDHMVLQRGPQKAVVWGYASLPQGTVNLNISGPGTGGEIYTTKVTPHSSDGGVWSVTLKPVTDTTPYTIQVNGPGGTAQLNDVLFGDVWLCSGQSNMQFTVNMSYNASAQLEGAANYTDIRLFTAKEATSNVSLDDLLGVLEPWSVPSTASLGGKEFTYFSDLCWLYGTFLHDYLNYPIGLIDTTWGGTAIELWVSTAVIKECNIAPKRNYNSILWNAMINPFAQMSIYGAIWYQGESNAAISSTYNCTFPAMIRDWRQHFSAKSDTSPDFPFGFVQLSAFRNDSSITTGFPDIRWHQTADVGYVPNHKMPNTFMAVAMDLPDFQSPWGSIHPRDKLTVARRLMLAGMNVAYNLSFGGFQGPFPESFQISRAYMTLYVRFDIDISPLRSKEGFEVICSPDNKQGSRRVGSHGYDDAVWSSVPIVQSDRDSVTLDLQQACANQSVAGVRYAWRESPCAYKACALYSSGNLLPAPPYRIVGQLPQK